MISLNPSSLTMVLKQKGKPEKGKKPVRGGPRQFSDHREFPDGPIEEFENLRVRKEEEESGSEEEESGSEVESSSEGEPIVPANNKPGASRPTAAAGSKPTGASKASPSSVPAPASSSGTKEVSRREREAAQKEQARQHYMKMKEKEDGARLALIRKQREEAAVQHAEALKAKEAAKKR